MSDDAADLTPGQQQVLDRFSETELAERFYFSGGSALASYYLHHRRSLDLDFFARESFPTSKVLELVNQLSEGEPTPRRVHDRPAGVLTSPPGAGVADDVSAGDPGAGR